jgi:hypothetical protein
MPETELIMSSEEIGRRDEQSRQIADVFVIPRRYDIQDSKFSRRITA